MGHLAVALHCIESYHDQHCSSMAHHYASASITSKVLWHLTLQKNVSLKNEKRHIDPAILETIQAGASWSSVRCNAVLPPEEEFSRSYEAEPGCSWTCPHLAQVENEVINSTQKFKPDLNDEHKNYYSRLLVTAGQLLLSSAVDPLDESPIFTTTANPEGIP